MRTCGVGEIALVPREEGGWLFLVGGQVIL